MIRVLAAILTFSVAGAHAADAPPTVYSVICAADDAQPVFQRVTEDLGGWPIFYIPAAVLRGGTCAEVRALVPQDEHYHTWAPWPDVRVRVEVTQ